jgi:hypothetical protein
MKKISPKYPVTQKGRDAIIPIRRNGRISESLVNFSFHARIISGGSIDRIISVLNLLSLHPHGFPYISIKISQIIHADAYVMAKGIVFLTIPL